MYRFLTIAFLFIAMALAIWALELQGKLVMKEKEISLLRKERDAAIAAENAARAETAPLGKRAARSSDLPVVPGPDVNAALLAKALKQMDSPEMIAMLRAQSLAEARKEYGGLLPGWNLSPSDLESVLGLLADRDSKEGSERLKAALGEARMKELEAFEKERELAGELGRYSDHLDTLGFPLSEPQRAQLAGIFRRLGGGSLVDEDSRIIAGAPVISEAQIANARRKSEAQQSAILRKAAGILTPDQASALQSAFRDQNDAREAGMRAIGQSLNDGKK